MKISKLVSVAIIASLTACGDSGDSVNASCNPITDSRDGQSYCTVTIGSQTWMAENLNYKVAHSYCYGWDKSLALENCKKYGRLYTWSAAMDSSETWTSNGKNCGYGKKCSPIYPVRGVCPLGWHLPRKSEFDILISSVGGAEIAGKMLKSTSGWYNQGNGSNDYLFTALPGECRTASEDYKADEFENAYFWTSTEKGVLDAYYLGFKSGSDGASLMDDDKKSAFSVRCIKDE